jgi:hypothetical protein
VPFRTKTDLLQGLWHTVCQQSLPLLTEEKKKYLKSIHHSHQLGRGCGSKKNCNAMSPWKSQAMFKRSFNLKRTSNTKNISTVKTIFDKCLNFSQPTTVRYRGKTRKQMFAGAC